MKRLIVMLALATMTGACAVMQPDLKDIPTGFPITPGRAYDFTYACNAQLGCAREHVDVVAVLANGWVLSATGEVINLANVLAFKVCLDGAPPVPAPPPNLSLEAGAE